MNTNNQMVMFFDLCRLCLAERGTSDIFEQVGLQNDITICTGIKVILTDNLPRKICNNCWEVIKKSMELRLIANKNNFHLKSLFEENNEDCELQICEELLDNLANRENTEKDKNISIFSSNVDCNVTSEIQIQASIKVRKDLFDSPQIKDHKRKKSKKKSKHRRDHSPKINKSSDECSVKEKLEKQHKEKNKSNESHDKSTECDKTENKEVKKDIKRLKSDRDNMTEFTCEECSKTFETFKKLYLHRRLHNKNVICPLDACGKKFATKGDLEKHFRTHTGEKPFECGECKSSFTQRGSLRAHMKAVHGIDLK